MTPASKIWGQEDQKWNEGVRIYVHMNLPFPRTMMVVRQNARKFRKHGTSDDPHDDPHARRCAGGAGD